MKLFLFLLLLSPTAWATNQPGLNAVLAHVAAVHDQDSLTPVVISDLDETLINSTPRRYQALLQASLDACGTSRAGDCGKALSLTYDQFEALANHYDLAPLFDQVELGFEFRRRIQDPTLNYYLSERFVPLDQAIAGAAEFIRELRGRGAIIFFATSRLDRDVWLATVESLKRLGLFEAAHPERLLLRTEGESSIGFKRRAFKSILNWSKQNRAVVQVVMENEPENMNAMTEIFPSADAIFVEGAFLKPGHVKGSPIRVENFL